MKAIPPDIQAEYDEWLASRPECVRKLAEEFPPGLRIFGTGYKNYSGPEVPIEFWVVGYNESDMVIATTVNPAVDFRAAMLAENKVYLCPAHIRAHKVAPGEV